MTLLNINTSPPTLLVSLGLRTLSVLRTASLAVWLILPRILIIDLTLLARAQLRAIAEDSPSLRTRLILPTTLGDASLTMVTSSVTLVRTLRGSLDRTRLVRVGLRQDKTNETARGRLPRTKPKTRVGLVPSVKLNGSIRREDASSPTTVEVRLALSVPLRIAPVQLTLFRATQLRVSVTRRNLLSTLLPVNELIPSILETLSASPLTLLLSKRPQIEDVILGLSETRRTVVPRPFASLSRPPPGTPYFFQLLVT